MDTRKSTSGATKPDCPHRFSFLILTSCFLPDRESRCALRLRNFSRRSSSNCELNVRWEIVLQTTGQTSPNLRGGVASSPLVSSPLSAVAEAEWSSMSLAVFLFCGAVQQRQMQFIQMSYLVCVSSRRARDRTIPHGSGGLSPCRISTGTYAPQYRNALVSEMISYLPLVLTLRRPIFRVGGVTLDFLAAIRMSPMALPGRLLP